MAGRLGACQNCKRLKVKCDRTKGSIVCRKCAASGQECTIPNRKPRKAPAYVVFLFHYSGADCLLDFLSVFFSFFRIFLVVFIRGRSIWIFMDIIARDLTLNLVHAHTILDVAHAHVPS